MLVTLPKNFTKRKGVPIAGHLHVWWSYSQSSSHEFYCCITPSYNLAFILHFYSIINIHYGIYDSESARHLNETLTFLTGIAFT